MRPRFSPHSRISQVDLVALRDHLIAVFKRWGRPVSIKVDNGQPLGDPQKKTIPVLALWLISFDIQVIWNRPRRPTDNAIVERMQGTTKRWVEIERCGDRSALQEKLNEVKELQRDHYEVTRLKSKTRSAVFPDLYEIKRRYSRADFDARRAHAFLSKTRFVRKVSSNGSISLYDQRYQVGLGYKDQEVAVGFDAEAVAWVVYSAQGQEIKRLGAHCFSAAHIWSLSVSQGAKS